MFRLSNIILFSIFSLGFARFCIHNEKSWCQGHNLWGWCFHNKSSGAFNCDDDAFCASQDQLKNKKSSGCFIRGNSSVCCCNDADGCNLGFIGVTPKYAHGQQCSNTIEVPNEDVRPFRNCDDPYCYSLLSSDEEGGPTTVIRGCHSRKMVMHQMSKHEDEKFQNNTKWKETEQMASLPTCADILNDQPKINGTTSLCIDFQFEQLEDGENVKKKGRLCCCEGSAKCNENQIWADTGITLTELKEEIAKRALGETSAAISKFGSILSLLGYLIIIY